MREHYCANCEESFFLTESSDGVFCSWDCQEEFESFMEDFADDE